VRSDAPLRRTATILAGVSTDARALADDAVALVRTWLADPAASHPDPAARRLAALLQDPAGLEFAVGFIDGVVRPEDPEVAAHAFRRLSGRPPALLSPWLRAGIRVGGGAAPLLPGVVVPTGRAVLRALVGHLLLDADGRRLGNRLRSLRAGGATPNVNLLGEAVLGPRQAARRLEGIGRLLARDDVDHLSVKVSATVAPHAAWAFDEAVDEVVETLEPLYAHAAGTGTLLTLDMEEYRDLDLTLAVFRRLLERPELRGLTAGVVLQAYLPDAEPAYDELAAWAGARIAAGGAPVRVRLVKGANLPMERVDAEMHGWPLATWSSKRETDTAYLRLLDRALTPAAVAAVRVGAAGHNLFDVALALLLARARGVSEGVEIEMLLGMAPAQAEAARRAAGGLLLYTPVVARADADSAIAYLVRRLEEGASPENFLASALRLADDEGAFALEEGRFRASLAALDEPVPASHRAAAPLRSAARPLGPGFRNAPDSDPAVAATRAWARGILSRAPHSALGRDAVAAATMRDDRALSAALDTVRAAAPAWAGLGAEARAEILQRAADVLERRRGELVEVMVAEGGKTFDQADPEVSEAVDHARHDAELAVTAAHLDGAVLDPYRVTLVVPPWNFPLAIPAGSALAALASGSAVLLKPSRRTPRTAALLVEALHEAGVPREALVLAPVAGSAQGSRLVADDRVDQVLLTGGYETAEAFRSLRPGLRLLAETSGKNAVVVTPSADLDLAARDVAASAFGHAGQKCSAASLVILVGHVARSRRFRDQLLDAVDAMRVGEAWDPATRMGPLIAPAEGKLLDALTHLAPGERWVRAPRRLDAAGRIWTPGVKTTYPGSSFHLTECFGPVLGVLTARDLDEALAIQNAVPFGLTAGLHSLDADEVAHWVERVEAGNLYVNRGTTGAIVRRQPFGGWKRSVVGPGAKLGGPSTVLAVSSFRRSEAHDEPGAARSPAVDGLLAAFGARGPADAAFLRRAAASDRRAWADEYGVVRDATGLAAERNAFRYRPVPVTVRAAAGADPADVARVLLAGLTAGGPLELSLAEPLAPDEAAAVRVAGVDLRVEPEDAWTRRAAAMHDARVRLVGGDAAELLEAVDGRPDLTVHDHPVTESGRVEALPFVREQAIAITAHRFGTPSHIVDAVPLTEPA
jgi:RHH-type proline utilization regulon transcriptional repressor/proline dehydrogenase/delta 1-pyrroline-5-carboxylate dehydrogenase